MALMCNFISYIGTSRSKSCFTKKNACKNLLRCRCRYLKSDVVRKPHCVMFMQYSSHSTLSTRSLPMYTNAICLPIPTALQICKTSGLNTQPKLLPVRSIPRTFPISSTQLAEFLTSDLRFTLTHIKILQSSLSKTCGQFNHETCTLFH